MVFSNPIVFNIGGQSDSKAPDEGLKKTILGKMRQNPFTTTAMANAYRSLYGGSIGEMPTTDLYVKLLTNSIEDLNIIDSLGIYYQDFPFEYEVIEMGDYYQELPEIEQYPVLYAVIKPNTVIPGVEIEIIDNLYLENRNLLLIGESYLLTGNQDDINGLQGLKLEDLGGSENLPYIIDNGNISCEAPCIILYHEIIQTIDGHNHVVFEPYCVCEPPSTSTECFPNINESRYPMGRIRVEDTQLSTAGNPNTFEPVRNAKMIVKDNWFTYYTALTNNDGCWYVNNNFYGKCWMWVEFNNDNIKLRGKPSGFFNFYKVFLSIKNHIGVISGPNYNNIQINYNIWTVNGSWAHLCWGAATVNNAFFEFNQYCSQDIIPQMTKKLDVLLYNNNGAGYCLMGTQYNLSVQAASNIFMVGSFWSAPVAAIIGISSGVMLAGYLPEVMIGIDRFNSDQIKHTVYHELGHASHYYKAGHSLYKDLVEAEINAWQVTGGTQNGDPHGDANVANAGLIALYESWAEHIGMTYADRTYGGNVSFTAYLNYNDFLEHRRNEEANHIPVGFYHDLIDGIDITEQAGDGAWGQQNIGTINDNVSGLTNAQLFSLIDNSVTSPNIFVTKLNNSGFISGANNVQRVNNLFNSY